MPQTVKDDPFSVASSFQPQPMTNAVPAAAASVYRSASSLNMNPAVVSSGISSNTASLLSELFQAPVGGSVPATVHNSHGSLSNIPSAGVVPNYYPARAPNYSVATPVKPTTPNTKQDPFAGLFQ
jgi:hypothetical protein